MDQVFCLQLKNKNKQKYNWLLSIVFPRTEMSFYDFLAIKPLKYTKTNPFVKVWQILE